MFRKIFKPNNERELRKLNPLVEAIKSHEAAVEKLRDEEFPSRIAELKSQIDNALSSHSQFSDIVKKDLNKALDPLLPETFALVREASKRVLGMRHYDVQMIGGIVLHAGKVAEMKTGEGKTLVATCPAVLNALTGGSVHVVTVNDYLASRDADWMGRIYRFLGLSVGVVVARQEEAVKRAAYESDITYGQNNEFGFDYLRDNMKFSLGDYKQRGHTFAIIDEVDSILIDEARTPLIISGQAEDKTPSYVRANTVIPNLRKDEHYSVDEKDRVVLLTEEGVGAVEQYFNVPNLYEPANVSLLHHVNQALRAHVLFKRDTDYVVDRGEVVIVDEHTGRLMPGRRWSDGLHGAIEAKEGTKIRRESRTLATITFQNYFRMYQKLSGMTGTADTEASEFAQIYDLDTMVIPTNRPIQREDQHDLVYRSEFGKFKAVAGDIAKAHEQGQPVLVGTTSVEKSEILSRELRKRNVPHNVLNAKLHRDEAGIIAQAGQGGAITIATNMAGRGTDILLGGNAEHMSRVEVAKELGQSEDQVANFAFLSGRPDLINVDNLIKGDMRTGAHRQEHALQLAELKKAAEEKGEVFTLPEGVPKTVEEVDEHYAAQQREYYINSIALYEKHLKVFDAICKEEKARVLDAGGLRVIGTERHESRRIDNQLRGRSGRQGDPGSSRFFLSLEDDLMRIFAGDRMMNIMDSLGMSDDTPIESKMVSRAIENAQKRVEGMHFDSRKNLKEYDDVMNSQRKAIYALRRQILESDPDRPLEEGGKAPDPSFMRELIFDLTERLVVTATQTHCPEKTSANEWQLQEMQKQLQDVFNTDFQLEPARGSRDDVMDLAFSIASKHWTKRASIIGEDQLSSFAAYIYLESIDKLWKDHLQNMDRLREGIRWRAYAQKDPKQEYKKEGYNLFQDLWAAIRNEVLFKIFHVQHRDEIDDDQLEALRRAQIERARLEASGTAMLPEQKNNAGRPAGPAQATSARPRAPQAPTAPSGPLPNALRQPQTPARPMNRAERRRQKAKGRKQVRN